MREKERNVDNRLAEVLHQQQLHLHQQILENEVKVHRGKALKGRADSMYRLADWQRNSRDNQPTNQSASHPASPPRWGSRPFAANAEKQLQKHTAQLNDTLVLRVPHMTTQCIQPGHTALSIVTYTHIRTHVDEHSNALRRSHGNVVNREWLLLNIKQYRYLVMLFKIFHSDVDEAIRRRCEKERGGRQPFWESGKNAFSSKNFSLEKVALHKCIFLTAILSQWM